MAKNNGNNGNVSKEQVEMMTVLHCKWNHNHTVTVPAEKRFFLLGGYRPGNFPERWQEINGEILCEQCAKKAKASLEKTRQECAKDNGQKSSTTTN